MFITVFNSLNGMAIAYRQSCPWNVTAFRRAGDPSAY
jgi:hypothetical protein